MDDYTIDEQGRIIVRSDPGSFIGLSDTPAAYAGHANQVVVVNAVPDAIAFASGLYWDEVSDRFGVGTSTPDTPTDVTFPGTPNVITTGLQLHNTAEDGADETGTGTAIDFRHHTTASVERIAARIIAINEATFAGALNNDAGIAFYTLLDAATAERVRISSQGYIGANITAPDRRIHAMDDAVGTTTIIPIARIESQVSGGVGATGHGPGFEYYGETTTTTNTAMAVTAARWSTATHASRRSRFEIRNYYIGNEVLCAVIEAPAYASADGNARGIGAVDLQGYRTAVTQVASGNYSVLIGGQINTADGLGTVCIGGYNNVASGDAAVVPGGMNNTADGNYSFAGGFRADTNGFDGVFIWADHINLAFQADRDDQFKVRCNGSATFVITETGAALPVAVFDQADVDEPFHMFIGDAAAATLTRDLVAEADVTTATRVGFYKIEVQDDGNQIADGDYYVPMYSLV